ncbi:MAG: glycosyltransferase family 1 protein [bacterium]|nr:glycosyltransferase family 1 protein [bacterium]
MSQVLKIGIDGRCLEGNRTGAGRYLENLLRYFGKDQGFAFYLYFKHEIPTDAYFQENSYKLRRLGSPLGFESNAWFTHVSLPRALKQDNVDMLFAPSYVAPWFCPIPTVLTLHDISYEAHPEWTPVLGRFLLGSVSKHAAKKAARIITISQFSKSEIMRLYAIPDPHITLTLLAPNGNFNQVVAPEEEADILKKLGVAGDFMLSVGTLINRRYPLETLRAFEACAKRIQGLKFVLVGPDRTYPPLEIARHIKEVNEKFGENAVFHIISVSDRELAVLYRKARALIWLSAYEGFGLPVLEAMALGTPVITSNTSSLPEVAGDAALRLSNPSGAVSSTSGVSLSAGPTVGSIADAMIKVSTDQVLRGWLIRKGRERAQKFSWELAANQTLSVFKQVLQK